MSRALLIANPASSQFTGGLHRSAIQALERHHEVDAAWPRNAAESRDLSNQAASEGVDIVVAMGGDGVVHHVAQGLIGSSAILGIVPVGTTNVLARILGAPSKPRRAVRVLAKGFDVARVPTLSVTGSSPTGEVRASALFALGIGPDAIIVTKAEADPHRKIRFGSVHYLNTALATIARDLRKREPDVTIRSGDREIRCIGAMAQFHSAYTFFGRVPLSFGEPDPMTLLVLERVRLRRLLKMLNAAIRTSRSLDDVKGISVWEHIDHFTAEAPAPIEVQVDGELLPPMTSVEVTHRPDSLTVAVSPLH